MRSIIFIESNTTGTGELFIQKAIEFGLDVFFFAKDPYKYNFIDKYNINFIQEDTTDFESLFQAIKIIPNVSTIFSSSEYFVEMANKLNLKFGKKANNPEAIITCRDKMRFYNHLNSSHLVPKAWSLTTTNIDTDFFSNGNDYVIKPVNGSGSVNVCKVDSLYSYEQAIKGKDKDEYLIQEYFSGEEFSVEVVSLEGTHFVISMIKKYLDDETSFVEVGHDFPASLPNETEQRIHSIVDKALSLVGYKNGFSHIELRVNEDGDIKIIEINPRLAGGMIPVLIENCTSLNLVDLALRLQLGQIDKVRNLLDNYQIHRKGVIRFKLAPSSGQLVSVEHSCQSNEDNLIYQLKSIGDCIQITGDFSDRIVCIISTSDTLEKCQIASKSILEQINIKIIPTEVNIDLEDTGRLKTTLHPYIGKIISEDVSLDNKLDEIRILLSIDEAHILMLNRQKLVSSEHLKKLLVEINKIRENNYEDIIKLPKPRGLYLTYEQYLISKLGARIGLNLQLARSRNDLNATTNAIICRDITIQLLEKLIELISRLSLMGLKHARTVLPIYSQFQTALPGTLGHYLMGFVESIQMSAESLYKLLDQIHCPLGAGSGGGTTLPIDTAYTARLLGFTKVFNNSLNAVSNRNINQHLSTIIGMIALDISRLSQDLQIWSTKEFGICSFPDFISGGSSAMPQKKNPYLLEWMKRQVGDILAEKEKIANALFKTPFSNSFEVSDNSVKTIQYLALKIEKLIQVTTMIVSHISINEDCSHRSIMDNYTYFSDLSEKLYAIANVPFRESHYYLGTLVDKGYDIENIIHKVNGEFSVQLSKEDFINFPRNYGMGPGSSLVKEHVKKTLIKNNLLKCELYKYKKMLVDDIPTKKEVVSTHD
ncbi:lyase family protein [Bacillus wiedmannii]|uniref:lyase family protein n=1 Tax=Bacillus wiedmannii TaxID=1890302 RepID=UPI000BF1AC26|nr:lyase family protein [Bacillus wiedmannii]PEM18978.1 hypothetical protein CN617_31550 [Bacillus wiedmannii]